MSALLQDLRFGLRGLARNPFFGAVVIFTLAVGIGANTVIYSVLDGMVLNPFPFPEPDRVVGVGTAYPRLGREMSFWENLSPAEFTDVRERSETLEEVVAWDMGNRQISGADGAPQNVFTAFWWGDALRSTGMSAAHGRGFTDQELREGAAVAVLSHRLWEIRFGADPDAVGRTLTVNGHPHTIVGVLPEGFLVYGTDLWTPLVRGPEAYDRDRRQFQVLARLAPDVELSEANAELETLARRVERAHGAEFEGYRDWRVEARTWTDVTVADVRPVALVLTGAVGFVLLLVCANVANLLLARASSRRGEVAVRTAMGAGRGRIFRQVLTESLVLAALAGAAGVALSVLGIRGLRELVAGIGVPLPGEIGLNGRVLAATAGVSLLAGLIFGVAPALSTARIAVADALRTEGRGSTGGRRRRRLQRVFVGAEVALALVLLSGAGLLVNSLVRLQAVDPGVRTDDVVTMRLTLPWEEYDRSEIPPFFRELTRRVEALPGVERAAAGTQFPPAVFARQTLTVEGRPLPPEGARPSVFTTIVTAGYFETLGIPLIRGRTFDPEEDRPDVVTVGVLNQAAARRYFPDDDPVGRRIRLPDVGGMEVEVVGVVTSTRNRGLDREPEPELFGLQSQLGGFSNQLFLLVQASTDPGALLPAVRREVRAMDPDQPVYAVQTVAGAFADETSARRVTTLFMSGFAAFALLLAALGIYAVVSFAVSERTREIGVRIALGAVPGQVRRLVVVRALVPVLVGSAIGLSLSLVAGRSLTAFLYRIRGTDPATLAGVAAVLVTVALAASWLPARRASRLDPAETLRIE